MKFTLPIIFLGTDSRLFSVTDESGDRTMVPVFTRAEAAERYRNNWQREGFPLRCLTLDDGEKVLQLAELLFVTQRNLKYFLVNPEPPGVWDDRSLAYGPQEFLSTLRKDLLVHKKGGSRPNLRTRKRPGGRRE